jgi:hypothetical protein
VLKRTMLQVYGMHGTMLDRLRPLLYPAFVLNTKLVHRRLAWQMAKQIHDYIRSGFSVVGVVGVDGSPSCGVTWTLDMQRAMDALAAIVRTSVRRGRGLYTAALQRALARYHVLGAFCAHDLVGELDTHG